LRAKRSNPPFRSEIDGLPRRFAPLRKRFAFVAGNDGFTIAFLFSLVMAGQKREARLRADVPAIHVFLVADFADR
jgi:hypothetical protein